MKGGISPIQVRELDKFLPCWANPWATLLPLRGTTENMHSLNLVACSKELEIKLQILEGRVTELVREL